MAFSTRSHLSMALGAVCLAAVSVPASAGTLSVPPLKDLSVAAPVTDVAYRVRRVSTVRHVRPVTVRRHYVGHRHYYYRRHHSAFPAAAFGLFAGALGAAIASSSYDDCYYPYGYGYGCNYGYGYPAYSYGYAYPNYSYGYAQPRFFYGGHRFHRHYGGFYGGRHIAVGGPRFVGGQHFVGGPRAGFSGWRGGHGGHRH